MCYKQKKKKIPICIVPIRIVWTSPLDRIWHKKDMAKLGSTVMEKDDQEKMRQALHDMGVKSPRNVPLKKLTTNNSEAETTSTGIWINPNVPEPRAGYVRYREAKKYWAKNENKCWERKGDNSEVLSYSFISILMGLVSINYMIEKDKKAIVPFAAVVLSGVKSWQERKEHKEIKRRQLEVLKKLGYIGLSANV